MSIVSTFTSELQSSVLLGKSGSLQLKIYTAPFSLPLSPSLFPSTFPQKRNQPISSLGPSKGKSALIFIQKSSISGNTAAKEYVANNVYFFSISFDFFSIMKLESRNIKLTLKNISGYFQVLKVAGKLKIFFG